MCKWVGFAFEQGQYSRQLKKIIFLYCQTQALLKDGPHHILKTKYALLLAVISPSGSLSKMYIIFHTQIYASIKLCLKGRYLPHSYIIM